MTMCLIPAVIKLGKPENNILIGKFINLSDFKPALKGKRRTELV